MTIEANIQKSFFTHQAEKTYLDKLLARKDVEDIKELIKKPKLNREQLLELLYMLSSSESKLLNYGEWDRYIILKFFVWVREFVKVAELLYDYEDRLEELKKDNKLILSPRTKQLLKNATRLVEHNAKFLIDLYLNIGRTTLSLGATAFLEALKSKYEISYPQGMPGVQPQQSKPLIWGLGSKKEK